MVMGGEVGLGAQSRQKKNQKVWPPPRCGENGEHGPVPSLSHVTGWVAPTSGGLAVGSRDHKMFVDAAHLSLLLLSLSDESRPSPAFSRSATLPVRLPISAHRLRLPN